LTISTIAWADNTQDFTSATAAGTLSRRQFNLDILPPDARPGQAARRFIEARYHEIFGSQAGVRYPNLLGLSDERGRLIAAVGIRRASDGPLFLEHYLHAPAETVIAAATGHGTGRSGIVELGSFAARSSRAATYLVIAMAAYMQHQGYSHALVTSTGRLRRLFSLFDFDLSCLGEAHKDDLPDHGTNWGHYYDDAPRVLAGAVPHCYAAVLRERDRQTNATRRGIIDNLIAQAQALSAC